jgi:hypothetical protein
MAVAKGSCPKGRRRDWTPRKGKGFEQRTEINLLVLRLTLFRD